MPFIDLAGNLLDSIVNDDASGRDRQHRFWGSRASFGLAVFGAIAAYFLFAEHRTHLFSALLTLVMFQILHVMYARLAMREAAELRERFGEPYEAWAVRTRRFVPARPPPPPAAQRT